MKCKLTNKEIKPFMSFGKMPLANGFLEENEFDNEYFFEMEVGFSENLSLFQLNDHPAPEKMFNKKYPFFTGSSELMKKHFNKYAQWIKSNYLRSSSKLIEIGSNDGTLLKNFLNTDIDYIGFEPSSNIAKQANANNIKTIDSFFNLSTVENLNSFKNKTDIICASNVICHIPDLNNLILSIDKLLSKKGCFIFEEPYMGAMFNKVSYDQIYDEHIYMFSITSIKKVFQLFDFDLIDVIPQVTHGGSMRYVVGRKNQHQISINVVNGLKVEKEKKLDSVESCMKFKDNCEKSKQKTKKSLMEFKSMKKNIAGYAATSKSTTILNYCKINHAHIDCIFDTTPDKINKLTPGTHIPIRDYKYFKESDYKNVFLFAWNHKKEILKKEKHLKKIEWFSHLN